MLTYFSANPVIARGMAGYNEGLTREALGRMQEAAAITQAELQAKAQRDALQSQAQQNAQANALEQQRLNQMAQYQQGTLNNQANHYKLMMESARGEQASRASESEKDRANRLEIAKLTTGVRDQTPAIKSEENQIATAAANYADALNKHTELQRQLMDISAVDSIKTNRAKEYFTTTSGAESEAKPKLSKYFAGEPVDLSAMSYDDALARAQNKFKAPLVVLQGIIDQGGKAGLGQYVAQGPDGKWISTFKPSMGTSINAPFGTRSGGMTKFFGDSPALPNVPIQAPPMVLDAGAPVQAPAFFGGGVAPVPASASVTPTTRPDQGPRVHVRFPNGAEADIPSANLQDAQTRLGATVVKTPDAPFFGVGGAPGLIMKWQQLLTAPR